jgi:hypothetical protein
MNQVGAIDLNRPKTQSNQTRNAGGSVNRPYLIGFIAALAIIDLTSCATLSRHQFVEPTAAWQTRTGQLLYRTVKTSLIGEIVVRFSKTGDFELTFSKGPGVTLLSLRQDASFAEVRGPLAGPGWSGPIEHAPQQLRGWLGLRDEIIDAQDRHLVRHVAGGETFLLRF